MPSATLDGVWAKIGRAQVNLGLFNREQSSWFESKPYSIEAEINQDLSNIFLTITRADAVPLELRTVMGDVIYDLRSALDHLAWQLVIANGGTPVTPEDNAGPSTAFPIFHSKEGAKGGPRPPVSIAGGVNTAALAVIERLQPYHRVDDPQLDPLWQLSELCNTDKHRLLLVVGVTYDALVTTTNGKISTTRMQEPIPLIIGRWVSAIGFHSYEDAVALQVDVEPTTLIAFSEGEPGAGHAVSEVLLDLTNMVEGIVDDLAPFVR